MKTFRFIIVNPHVGNELELFIHHDGENIALIIEGKVINIDEQQLGELGGLFLALAGKFDYDSIPELLDGYDLPIPELLVPELLE